MPEQLSREDILQLYVKKHGKNQAGNVINWLAKTEPFIEAITSEVGRQIMSAHVDRASRCFNEYHTLLEKEEDFSKMSVKTVMARAEYNVCLKIIKDVQAIINKYHKDQI